MPFGDTLASGPQHTSLHSPLFQVTATFPTKIMPPTQGQQALEHPLQEQLQPNMLVLTATMTQRALVLGSCCHLQHAPAVTKCLGYSVHCPNHPPPPTENCPTFGCHSYFLVPTTFPVTIVFLYTVLHLSPLCTFCHLCSQKGLDICGWAKEVRMEMSSLPASIFKVLKKKGTYVELQSPIPE